MSAGRRVLTSLAEGLRYAESPRWKDGLLYVSDVHAYEIRVIGTDGSVSTVAEVPQRPAGLGFHPDGTLWVATAFDRALSAVVDGELHRLVDLSPMTTGLLNDMIVDGSGRAYVGATGFNLMAGEEPVPGQIVMFDGTRADVVATDVMFPNGIAVTPDGRTLVVAETAANRVSTFQITPAGGLGDRTTWAELPSAPDGLCLDADGGAWVALLTEGRFVHLDAHGVINDSLPAPGALAVACTTTDGRRDQLTVCSAHTTMADLARGVSTATIHLVQLDVVGAGLP
jgi:sugar lactone lactonase YvrE